MHRVAAPEEGMSVMRVRGAIRGLVAVAGVLPLLLTSGPAVAATPTYRSTDLGTLGGTSSYSIAMNERGAVVGRAQTADETYHGFVWSRGVMTDLGLFSPTDINDRGAIVGTRDDVGGTWVWQRGRFTPLSGPGGRVDSPRAINDKGQVVGFGPVPDSFGAPVLWSKGTVTYLPLLDVTDINDRGVVSGAALADGGVHAATWRRGRITDLGGGARDRGSAFHLNNRGWVVGWTADAEGDERATLWRDGRTLDLGDLGGNFSHAIALNKRGAVLLLSQIADGNVRPALWQRGVLTDLTTRGVPADSDYADLSDKGWIAGSTRIADGVAHAMLWR